MCWTMLVYACCEGYDICKSDFFCLALGPFFVGIMLEYNWNVSFLMLFHRTKLTLGNFPLLLFFAFSSWVTNACVPIFRVINCVVLLAKKMQPKYLFSIHTCLDILICDSCSVCLLRFFLFRDPDKTEYIIFIYIHLHLYLYFYWNLYLYLYLYLYMNLDFIFIVTFIYIRMIKK